MSSSSRQLTELQEAYLRAVLDHFQNFGEWPTSHPLSRKLVQQMNIREVEQSLPPGFIYGRDTYLPDRSVVLTLPALRELDGADAELAAFVRVVHFCVQRYLDPDTLHPALKSNDLRVELGMDDLMMRKIHLLLTQENLLAGGSMDQSGTNWSYEISEYIRAFVDVSSIDDYLAARRQPESATRTGTVISSFSMPVIDYVGFDLPLLTVIHDSQLCSRCEDLLKAQAAYDRVIREACVILEDRVRAAAGIDATVVGTSLMEQAFSPNRGPLQLSPTQMEQLGAMQLYRGTMAFFRNAAGHRVIETYSRDDALRFVAWVDLLLRLVELSTLDKEARGE